jgi:molecular chaperone DnaK (HSP70)
MPGDLTKVFGLDLGTTNSYVACVDEAGVPRILPNCDGDFATPSAVMFDGDNVVVGIEAKNCAEMNPDVVVVMVKRAMGDPDWAFDYGGTSFRPEQILSFVVRKVIGDAERHLNEKITDVVVTCPAYFGVVQREATAKACELAGLNVRAVLNEPAAAAIGYGAHQAEDQVMLVYDVGGSSFDVTMIEVKGGNITILFTGGNHELGGRDWDAALVRYLVETFQQETGTAEDILEDPVTWQDLLTHAETAKKTLSRRQKTALSVTHIGHRVRVDVTREKFDELSAALLDQTIQLTRQMLAEAAAMGHTRFDKILLAGGATKMPQVQSRLQQEFSVPCELYDPDQVVAKGAAIFGGTPVLGEEVNVNSCVATEADECVEELFREATDAPLEVPDRTAVAHRFSLPPAEPRAIDILNVSSRCYGLRALNARGEEVIAPLISRNSPLPVEVKRTFGIAGAGQSDIQVELCEYPSDCDDPQVDDVTAATDITVEVPPGLPAGHPIDIYFRLGGDGTLEILAETEIDGRKLECYRGSIRESSANSGSSDRLFLPTGTVDRVHFSVTSPTTVRPGTSFNLDVWAHLQHQRNEVIERAREALGGEELRIASKGPVAIARKTILSVKLTLTGLLVEDAEDTILWDNEIGNASFCVMVPPDVPDGPHPGKAGIYIDGLQIARVYFTVLVAAKEADVQPLPLREERHRTAFASYAHSDRDEVLGRVQGIQKAAPEIEFFLDVLSLRSGEDWETQLWQKIPASDIFYLFWSRNAIESPWVEKEWRCALSARGTDFIDPVPLDPPDLAPPPPELASKHFNDWVLAFMGERKRSFARSREEIRQDERGGISLDVW